MKFIRNSFPEVGVYDFDKKMNTELRSIENYFTYTPYVTRRFCYVIFKVILQEKYKQFRFIRLEEQRRTSAMFVKYEKPLFLKIIGKALKEWIKARNIGINEIDFDAGGGNTLCIIRERANRKNACSVIAETGGYIELGRYRPIEIFGKCEVLSEPFNYADCAGSYARPGCETILMNLWECWNSRDGKKALSKYFDWKSMIHPGHSIAGLFLYNALKNSKNLFGLRCENLCGDLIKLDLAAIEKNYLKLCNWNTNSPGYWKDYTPEFWDGEEME